MSSDIRRRTMQTILETVGTLVYKEDDHCVYKLSWSKASPLMKKWKYNRDPDPSRVHDMIEQVQNGIFVPKVFYVAEVDDFLACYDGNHRREVLDFLRYEGEVLLDTVFQCNHAKIRELFVNLNKAVQVPDLFIDTDDHRVRLEILDVVKYFAETYPAFVSPSNRCRAPNFNRDNLVDFLYHTWKRFENRVSVEQIKQALLRLNEKYCKDTFGKGSFPAMVSKKCNEHSFWLFRERVIPFESIQFMLHELKIL